MTKAETPLDGLEADDATFAGGPVAAFTFTASSAGGLFKARIER